MASLATYVKGFVGIAELADVPAAVWAQTESPRLRPIANEDVYLFVKRIDNSTVIRAADPAVTVLDAGLGQCDPAAPRRSRMAPRQSTSRRR